MSNTFTSLVRIGTDPEIRTIPSGSQVLAFSAASSVGFGDKQSTLWVRVSYWRNPDKIINCLKKGDQLVISGELTQREYQANDGTTKTSLELNANIIDLVGKKQDGGQQQQHKPQQIKPAALPGNESYDQDIPF